MIVHTIVLNLCDISLLLALVEILTAGISSALGNFIQSVDQEHKHLLCFSHQLPPPFNLLIAKPDAQTLLLSLVSDIR